jgi:hypothetical protein
LYRRHPAGLGGVIDGKRSMVQTDSGSISNPEKGEMKPYE